MAGIEVLAAVDAVDAHRVAAATSSSRPAWRRANWLSAALASAVAVALADADWPAVAAMIAGLLAGGLAWMSLAPWHTIDRADEDRRLVETLAERLCAIDLDERRQALTTVLLDRADAFGDLSRALHDCLSRAVGAEQEAKMLRRSMREAVERSTRRAVTRLARDAMIDPLTGVGNRRALGAALAEFKREAESTEPVAAGSLIALMIDLDHFKRLNDTLGHEAGDACLVLLADLLRSTVSRNDHIIRLGGDEFVVLLRGATLESASALAGRVRSLYAQTPWTHDPGARPTISIGLAEVAMNDPEALEKVMRRADAALYVSKRGGRDRVVAS